MVQFHTEGIKTQDYKEPRKVPRRHHKETVEQAGEANRNWFSWKDVYIVTEAGSPAGRRREPKRGDPSPPRLHPPSCIHSGGVLKTTAKGIAGARGVLRPALSRQRLPRAFARCGSHTVTPPPRWIPAALPAQFLPPGREPGPATRPGLLRPPRRDESAPGWDRI
ncbi:hypothetical protein LEMLEM_LOCUS27396 [Lemmus lemmus]